MQDQILNRDQNRDSGLVFDRANDVKDKASHALDGAAGKVERAGHTMSERVATAADKASAALGSTAEYVRDIDSRDIMQDLSGMAKRHPGATLAAAVVVGFFVGRSVTRS